MTRRVLPLLLLVVLLAAGCGRGGAETQPANIVVSEVGRATAKPDTVTITFGINTKAPSASQALALNQQHTDGLIAALRSKGATEANVDPRQLSVFPDTEPNQPQVGGYEAVNQVIAKSKKLGDAGTLIDAGVAVAPDAVRILGLNYGVDAQSAVYASARKDALRRAKERAEQLAAAAGLRLGNLSAVKESEGEVPTAPFFDDTAPGTEAPTGPAIQNPGGGTDVAVEVTAVYEVEG